MQRRTLLGLTGTALTTSLAGCNSDGNGSGNPDDNVYAGNTSTDTDAGTNDGDGGGEGDDNGVPAESQPAFQARDADADGTDGELEIAFHARTYTRLEDGDQFWEADDGEMYLLGQYHVQNVGDQTVDLLGGQIAVQADDTEGEWTVVKDGSRFRVTLEPDDELDEWLVHTIPADASEVTVSYDAAEDIAATVEHDDTVEFTFPEA